MPVEKNPGELRSGSGRKSPTKGDDVRLIGSGMAGAGPNIGQPGYVPGGIGSAVPLDGSNLTEALNDPAVAQALAASVTHAQELKGAHAASAISIDSYPDTFFSDNVEGALDEIIGTIPKRPAFVGDWFADTTFNGIADWGVLKLNDSSLVDRGLVASTNDASIIYPYYLKVPSPAIGFEFSPDGADPTTDTEWNSDMTEAALEGSGPGKAYAGGFTENGAGVLNEELRLSLRLLNRTSVVDGGTGRPERQEVTVSGTVFPADRGVLALIHWPGSSRAAVPDETDFLAQDLDERCVAALLLGQGMLAITQGEDGANCFSWNDCADLPTCDGGPGGIFSVGADDNGHYDPYQYPGRAGGQYDLLEVLRGVSNFDGTDLRAPFDDLDGDATAGAKRVQNTEVPGAGQVRLGTDLTAGEADPTTYGIPILGAPLDGYSPAPALTVQGHKVVGDTVVEAAVGGQSNFFRYRLPVLADYTSAGLKWTPSGSDPTASKERVRYLSNASPSQSGSAYLATAGNYGTMFDEDYWVWQIARFRHTFMMKSDSATGLPERVGSYWLMHFKKEANFEAFVRDGVMPWDVSDGYELYSASLVDTTNLESVTNEVNEETSTAVFAPDGPAPLYGYKAASYHSLRSKVFLDPETAMPAFTATYDYSIGPNNTVQMSGVHYFRVINPAVGGSVLSLTSLSVTSDTAGFWDATYRTDDLQLTNDTTAPALLSSPRPAFLGMQCFSFDELAGAPTMTVPTGAAGAAITDSFGPRKPGNRIEIPYTHMGSNGFGVYTAANAPREADDADIVLAGGNITFSGDRSNPSFSRDAKVRVFYRRPLGHDDPDQTALPFVAVEGHGLVIPPADGKAILAYTSEFDSTNLNGSFANDHIAGGTPVNTYVELFTADKDTQERFLDETYRVLSDFGGTGGSAIDSLTAYNADTVGALVGPGLGAWAPSPVEFPTRSGYSKTYAPAWGRSSFLAMAQHLLALGSGELQVAGLPDRNPPISEGVALPYPSAGILMYPKHDYTTGYRPWGTTNGGVDFTGAQPDYSAAAGDRDYIRCFDANFLVSGTPENVSGHQYVTLRIDGVQLEDLAYLAPGPGHSQSTLFPGPGILVKVPGMTTWMDAGRYDGDGPSKQDVNLDGAGCLVPGPNTINGVDAETGLVYCQIHLYLGPLAMLFENTGVESVPVDKAPLLVKVILPEGAKDIYDLDQEFMSPGRPSANPAGNPGVLSGTLRGITGIKMVRPSEL